VSFGCACLNSNLGPRIPNMKDDGRAFLIRLSAAMSPAPGIAAG
jgi:hypothetical protein